MMEIRTRPFNYRGFVAIGAALSGLGLPLTGYANHLHQMGPMTTSRHIWMTAHNALGVLFVLCVITHVVFNRKTLFRHFRFSAVSRIQGNREFIWAVAILAVILVLAIAHAAHF